VFAVTALAYVGTFLGMFLLPHPLLRAAMVVAQPLLIGGLFVIGHDAAHNSLTHLGWLNRLLGRLAFLPAWHPFTSWAWAHNALHHRWTSFKGREPAFPPFSKAEFDRLPRWRRWLERFYRTPAGIGFYYTLDFYAKHLLVPRGASRPPYRLAFQLDRLLVLGFFAGQLALAWRLTGFTPGLVFPRPVFAVFCVVVPWLSWIWFMGFVSYVQHTHPTMPWYDAEDDWSFHHVQLTSTAHVTFPWPLERLMHNIMDHPAHHLDPGIPLYELPASQRELEERCPGHAVVVRWTPADYFRTCAACKLYDFDRQCWTDFTGRPTTPPRRAGRPDPENVRTIVSPPAAATA
jgi:omega-6 fatty acid desaturase (delta-12 desaturase)